MVVKKAVSLLVLSVMVAHLAGYYVYFTVRMHQVRSVARLELRQSPISQLTRFEFTEGQYREARVDENEIKVDGKMYDVARVFRSGDVLVVLAKHDEAEDNLLTFFNEVFKQSWSDGQETPTSLVKFFSLNYLTENTLVINCQALQAEHRTAFLANESLPWLHHELPPPRS